jgi:hypothetical protein
MTDLATVLPIVLRPDSTRTVIRPFQLGDAAAPFADEDHPRIQNVIDRVLELDAAGLQEERAAIDKILDDRHPDLEQTLLRRYDDLAEAFGNRPPATPEQKVVLTHGVGVVREYSMGACLLDKNDPTKLLARLNQPLLQASGSWRDGYVPNVVYSCGSILRDRTLLMPYGAADNFAAFATVHLDDLLAAMS